MTHLHDICWNCGDISKGNSKGRIHYTVRVACPVCGKQHIIVSDHEYFVLVDQVRISTGYKEFLSDRQIHSIKRIIECYRKYDELMNIDMDIKVNNLTFRNEEVIKIQINCGSFHAFNILMENDKVPNDKYYNLIIPMSIKDCIHKMIEIIS